MVRFSLVLLALWLLGLHFYGPTDGRIVGIVAFGSLLWLLARKLYLGLAGEPQQEKPVDDNGIPDDPSRDDLIRTSLGRMAQGPSYRQPSGPAQMNLWGALEPVPPARPPREITDLEEPEWLRDNPNWR